MVAPDDASGRGEDSAPDLLWGARGVAFPQWREEADEEGAPAAGDNGHRQGGGASVDGTEPLDHGEVAVPADTASAAALGGPPPTNGAAASNGPVGAFAGPRAPVIHASPATALPPVPPPVIDVTPEPRSEPPRQGEGTRHAEQRRRRGVPSGPRAEWVLHRIRVWSVVKLAFCVYLFLYAVLLLAAALVWWIAASAGLVHNMEKFLRDVGFTDFRFHGGQLMQGVAIGGAIALAVFTVFTALAAAVVNVISELTGGLRLIITERAASGTGAAKVDDPDA